MKKPRILLITHYFSTHRGGIEQVAAQLAARLAAEGEFEIEWMATGCDPAPALPAQMTALPVSGWNGLERAGIPWPIWSRQSLQSVREAVARADVVHLHDFIYSGNITAFRFARLYRKPIVITQHIGDATYENAVFSLGLKLINRTLGRFMLARADQVIFISDHVRRQFMGHTRFRSLPLLWPNGVDTATFCPVSDTERDALRARMGVEGQQKVILFAGRFIAMKGMALMRALAAATPQYRWWFAGWGDRDSPHHPAAWNLANVTVFENRTGATLAECYRAADMMILPSFSEGFPLVVQEALACGTPALVSLEAAIGAPGAKEELTIGSLQPEATALPRWLAMLEDALDKEALSSKRAGRADYARKEWAWEHYVPAYAALFRRLAGR